MTPRDPVFFVTEELDFLTPRAHSLHGRSSQPLCRHLRWAVGNAPRPPRGAGPLVPLLFPLLYSHLPAAARVRETFRIPLLFPHSSSPIQSI